MQSLTHHGNTVFIDDQTSAKNPKIVFFILRFSVVEQYMSKRVSEGSASAQSPQANPVY